MNEKGVRFLILLTYFHVVAGQINFLLTVPRHLWQGSREEFCMSFHDDIDAFYNVTILLNEEEHQVGYGYANGEGKVCHPFMVPDKTGRGKLRLWTETTKELEEFVSTTIGSTQETEIEIHESSLETLIQTDKPLYKPGEKVKFRAMTINRDLKPWTGMVPLVVVKNPGDVRVMQWKDVKNDKGLLSFEMPLSKDPPLGEWNIAITVEGKEHVQPFKVQEYVLPKYEVQVTAPTFLLPTTDYINASVCAKYTYGKPVKGKVQISVCYVDVSPYFYYYRYEQEERPCAARIMDINGCVDFSVEGSELMLSSSNFSRYGNLVINATVTEQATGISLNGTVQGPEMTFEAVKMTFEDDTHNYFKEAFPYYARVIVTKPDGSPAPGELIEISADNYDPEYHLKRNFTSDENGIVKFAIKNLPKNVNRLSFSARAPKYYTPYGRYHYIIRMYEPRANHYANKWYSPSNSYIHVPAVDSQLQCGSEAEFEILYSTPPDTDYKFFVQVLSKSHVVHHTHVRHHFKIHDAVNFDGIPDEMLLDPYTPPPRPTYYYPIDPIPYYDDPELGFKPEPENITITVDDLLNDTSVGETGEVKEPCNLLALLSCAQPMREVAQDSVKKMCQIFETFQECIKPHRYNCKDESSFKSLVFMETNYKSICKNSDCDVLALSKCMEPMSGVKSNDNTVICKLFTDFQACVSPFQQPCQNSEVFKTIGMIFKTYGKLCGHTEKEEENDAKLCENLYKRYENRTVILDPQTPISGSNYPDVKSCAKVCNDDPKCRGFMYEGEACMILYKSYDVRKEAEGIDFYDRHCYTEVDPNTVQSDHVGRVRVSFPVTANMGPESKLLVYYVRKDGEVVAATLNFKVQRCFDNKVEMKFDRETVYPGNPVHVNVKASPGSLCSVGVVDKSITLIGGNHQITPEKIFDSFTMPYMYRSYWKEDKAYCDRKTRYDKDLINPADWWSNYRNYDTDAVDAVQAFREMNLIVMTDMTIETRPCKVQTRRPVYYYGHNRGIPGPQGGSTDFLEKVTPISTTESNPSPKQVGLRQDFPETWLWDLHIVGEDGEVTVETEIPHTITEWVGNSLCTNMDTGVGVSPMTGITAFQPFFLSFTLPYSAMQVSMPVTSDFGIEGSQERSVLRCVCPGETATIKYRVIPYTLGKIKILATAESIPDDGTCGNSVVSLDGTGANDAVERELLIEAEGIEKEYTATSYLCPEGTTETEDLILPLPSKDLVDDSARGYINVIGDIMGPALSNLNDLLKMPYGCGEQNMASFSPNIVALQYLTNTNQLLPKIEEEAKGYMRIGYQRQLKYRHADGSYSAFGGDGSGSSWLTAFVVKCLGQSRPYISIDDKDLEKSITWFRSKQLENGCFPKIGYTHSYYLKGGFSDRSNDASITAFTLIAMLEAGIPSTDQSVINAVRCLDIQDINDTYTLAIMAYAYTLYDIRHGRRQQVMKMLDDRATVQDGMKFWERTETTDDKEKKKWYYTAVSAEVEMTAYALLAHVSGEQDNAALNGRPIVMWLTKQRNPRGGFSSTQDTIIALQALARYATLVYQGGVDVTINTRVEREEDGSFESSMFHISDDNTLVLQSQPITKLPATLKTRVSGIGCAMVQANVKYNVYEPPTSPTFQMKVNAYRAKDHTYKCSMRTINICVKFTGPGGVSNMAIVDVKMVTGWVPVEDTLKKLVQFDKISPEYIGIEKYELDGSYVHFYFDQLDSQRRCFLFDVEQTIEVSNPKDATVKVYDYYETDFQLITKYNIKTTCGTKEELPFVTPEEYYSGLLIDDIVQVRIPFGGERLTPSQTRPSCPVCHDDIDTTTKSFKSMVCGSSKIYKVQTGRKGDYPLKVYANVRTKKKEQIRMFVKKNFDDRCTCSLMQSKKKGKVLVFSEQNPLDQSEKSLTLNSSTTIIKVSKALEKAVWRLVRRNKC